MDPATVFINSQMAETAQTFIAMVAICFMVAAVCTYKLKKEKIKSGSSEDFVKELVA